MSDAPPLAITMQVIEGSIGGPVKIATESRGKGPWCCLLIHGFGDNLVTWSGLTSVLAARDPRLARVDLPGFGATPLPSEFARDYCANAAALVLELARRERPRPVLLVGHSLGAGLVLGACEREASERAKDFGRSPSIRGAVLIAPATRGMHPPLFLQILNRTSARWMDRLGAQAGEKARQGAARILARIAFRMALAPGRRPDPDWLRAVQGSLARPGALSDLASISENLRRVLSGNDPSAELEHARIGIPIAVVQGAKDRVVNLSEASSLVASLPNAEFHTLPDVGHCPQREAPAAVARIVLETAAAAGLISPPDSRGCE